MTGHGDHLLLTTGEGVLRLDARTGETRQVLGLPGSRDAAIRTATGTTLLCGAATVTARAAGTGVTPVAGPFPNLARLLAGSAEELWVFPTTGPPGYGCRHTLT
ncbi:hypothetical protein ADK55_31720, partial [Streptomyces sp. WM4235]|uniref:hypothetical protein n=1 Tax=Streptomyces sp. WM4235 TaxID=1415551 RepID=UPI0006C658F5